MLESEFKKELKKEIEKKVLPGSMVFHLDPQDRQGIPDLIVLYKSKWATLEGKKNAKASHQPNQDYYVGLMNDMSFSRFICPENKEEVLNELQQSLKSNRTTRIPRS